jgi:transcription elongation factor GreA
MKIVGSTESDILADLPTISNESLVGKTLLWKKKGDTIEINSNRNIKKYKILNIK